MKLNLKEDFDKVYEYVLVRINSFDVGKNVSPKSDLNSISLISMGYQYDQAGWVALIFDTREQARPDGEWTKFIEENSLNMSHWFELIDRVYEHGDSLTIETLDGSQKVIGEDAEEEEFECIGEMLKGVLVKARADGVFKNLPLADMSVLSLEEFNGSYGWPEYDNLDTAGNVRNA